MKKIETQIAMLLRHISHPARIRILLAIGEGEACVCHLETALGYRQAYLSQHLMELRKSDILDTYRDGRYIFYHIKDLQILVLIQSAARMLGFSTQELNMLSTPAPISNCCCPMCSCEHDQSSLTKEKNYSKEI